MYLLRSERPIDKISHFWKIASFKLHMLHAAQLLHKAEKKNLKQNSWRLKYTKKQPKSPSDWSGLKVSFNTSKTWTMATQDYRLGKPKVYLQSSVLKGNKKETLFYDSQWSLQVSGQTWYLEACQKHIQDLPFPAHDRTKALVRFLRKANVKPSPMSKIHGIHHWRASSADQYESVPNCNFSYWIVSLNLRGQTFPFTNRNHCYGDRPNGSVWQNDKRACWKASNFCWLSVSLFHKNK